MKKILKMIPILGISLGLALISEAGDCAESAHYLGLSYVSGARDVWNWHEDNLNLDDDIVGIPIGISYRYATLFESGMRLDVGVGPAVLIVNDVDYHDIPLQLSVGYSFLPSSDVRLYTRIGASIHINDGDYVKDEAGVGAIGAIGLEFGAPGSVSFFAEAAYDSAKATFSTLESNEYYTRRFSEEEITVNDFLLTLGVRF